MSNLTHIVSKNNGGIQKGDVRLLRKYIRRIRFYMKLKQADRLWYYMGGNGFGLFPPSFCLKHMKDMPYIADKTLKELKQMIDEYISDN